MNPMSMKLRKTRDNVSNLITEPSARGVTDAVWLHAHETLDSVRVERVLSAIRNEVEASIMYLEEQ